MAEAKDDELLLHWDGTDGDLAERHLIDAETLTQTINGVQEMLYLIAMDLEGREPRERANIPREIRKRFQLAFDATIPASFCLRGKIGVDDDLLAPGVVPAVKEKFCEVMDLLADERSGTDCARAFASTVRNPVIRRRVASACRAVIPGKGSGRTFGLLWGPGREIRIDENGHNRLARMTPPPAPEKTQFISVVTGLLYEMDFENRGFKLFYPPTRNLIACHYDDNDEAVLVDSRREFVQVKGRVLLDAQKMPIRVNSVESVINLDLSDIELAHIPFPDGRVLLLDHTLILAPSLDEESRQLLEVSDSENGINTFAQTRDELIESIYEDVETIWFHYVENEGPLTDEAARIGDWWRKHARLAGGE